MDMGNGTFGELSQAKFEELKNKEVNGLFRTGEQLEIRGTLFEVENIGTHFLTLRILSR